MEDKCNAALFLKIIQTARTKEKKIAGNSVCSIHNDGTEGKKL